MKIKNIGVLTEEAQGWVLASEYLKKKAPEAGINIIADEHYGGKQVEYRDVVLRLLAKKPEMVILLSNPPHTEILIKRLREIRPDQRFTGYFEYLETPSLVAGIPFVAQFSAAPWFEKEFLEQYNERFKARAPHGFDIIALIAAAQETRPIKLSGKALVSAISQVRGLNGATGLINMSPTRNIESVCVWKEAKGEEFVLTTLKSLS
jgi:ABC-type branched-subunit amino acid transport system substrate-binding protein